MTAPTATYAWCCSATTIRLFARTPYKGPSNKAKAEPGVRLRPLTPYPPRYRPIAHSSTTSKKFGWPGLHVRTPEGEPSRIRVWCGLRTKELRWHSRDRLRAENCQLALSQKLTQNHCRILICSETFETLNVWQRRQPLKRFEPNSATPVSAPDTSPSTSKSMRSPQRVSRPIGSTRTSCPELRRGSSVLA